MTRGYGTTERMPSRRQGGPRVLNQTDLQPWPFDDADITVDPANGSLQGGSAMRALTDTPLTDEELARIDAYWRAANYLSVGQIYLMDNPLLDEPLRPEQVKPRLLGHWGTTPGLNLLYAH